MLQRILSLWMSLHVSWSTDIEIFIVTISPHDIKISNNYQKHEGHMNVSALRTGPLLSKGNIRNNHICDYLISELYNLYIEKNSS